MTAHRERCSPPDAIRAVIHPEGRKHSGRKNNAAKQPDGAQVARSQLDRRLAFMLATRPAPHAQSLTTMHDCDRGKAPPLKGIGPVSRRRQAGRLPVTHVAVRLARIQQHDTRLDSRPSADSILRYCGYSSPSATAVRIRRCLPAREPCAPAIHPLDPTSRLAPLRKETSGKRRESPLNGSHPRFTSTTRRRSASKGVSTS